MELDCPHLSLAPSWADDDDDRRVVLVRAIDALGLCRDGGYEEECASAALWAYESQCHRLIWKLRDFALTARLASPYSTGFQDEDLIDLVREAIARGSLIGVREIGGGNLGTEQTVVERRLVRNIESRSRGRLNDGARQYKLVPGSDLSGIKERNSYEVVGRDESRRVLDELAKQAGADLALLLKKANDQLTLD
jgi:hypothetical protein